MPDFSDYWNALKDGIRRRIGEELTDLRQAAEDDADTFLEKVRDDLTRWTKLLAAGDLTPEELQWLVKGKEDLAEMEALKRAGLELVRVERLRNTMIALVIDTAVDTFL